MYASRCGKILDDDALRLLLSRCWRSFVERSWKGEGSLGLSGVLVGLRHR
jgi:hypothetical protein